jgi:uncharacterized protein (TIGR00369 family)
MAPQFSVSNPDYAKTVRDSFARQGLMTTLGARIVAIEPGFCVVEMGYTPGVSQQQGFFHGGAIGAIADSAAGYAAYSLMPAGAEILTVRIQAQPDPPGRTADLARRGPRVAGRQDVDRVPRRCFPCGARRAGGLRTAAVDLDAGGASGLKKRGPCRLSARDPEDKRGVCHRSRRQRIAGAIYAYNTNALSGRGNLAACTTYVLGNQFEDNRNPVDNSGNILRDESVGGPPTARRPMRTARFQPNSSHARL